MWFSSPLGVQGRPYLPRKSYSVDPAPCGDGGGGVLLHTILHTCLRGVSCIMLETQTGVSDFRTVPPLSLRNEGAVPWLYPIQCVALAQQQPNLTFDAVNCGECQGECFIFGHKWITNSGEIVYRQGTSTVFPSSIFRASCLPDITYLFPMPVAYQVPPLLCK